MTAAPIWTFHLMCYQRQLHPLEAGAVLLEHPQWLSSKESACSAGAAGDEVGSLCQEDSLEEGTATYSSILVWRPPWIEEPGGLQSIGSQELDTT